MRVAIKKTRLGLLNSHTRIAFRYGNVCLTACPQAVMQVVIETDGSSVQAGYSGDCLPPGWFDKSPGRTFKQQIDDMLAVAAMAEHIFSERMSSGVNSFFDAWLDAYDQVHQVGGERGFQPLLTSFGISLVERAVMDGMARAAGVSLFDAIKRNIYRIEPGRVHDELQGLAPSDWLPNEPTTSIYVRQTVGLGDPLTEDDILAEDRIDDGRPIALEQYIVRSGVRYFKVKLANKADTDRLRLLNFAAMVESHLGDDYRLTLDGNEQYKKAEDFDALIEMLRNMPQLQTLLNNVIAFEQPLDRSISLEFAHTAGIRELGKLKPVIIDESDGELAAYSQALDLGYRGVSSKNCKGPIKSLLNNGLTWLRNGRGQRDDLIMTGEDLCSVGIVPVQSDLCLAAVLGLDHVERNGHHYHPGLRYLPAALSEDALRLHSDFYERVGDMIVPRIRDGGFDIASLQCPGYGFAVEPDMEAMQLPEQWEYESLGI